MHRILDWLRLFGRYRGGPTRTYIAGKRVRRGAVVYVGKDGRVRKLAGKPTGR